MRRRSTFRSTLVSIVTLLGVAAFLVLLVNAIAFRSARLMLSKGTQVADLDVSGLSANDAISQTVKIIQSPVTLRYLDNSITLTPEQIDFVTDETALRAQIDTLIQQQSTWTNLPAFILRQSSAPVRVPLPYTYSDAKLQDFLLGITQQYDQAPQQASPDLSAKQLAASQPGRALNLAEAPTLILNTLTATTQREVILPVDILAQQDSNVQALSEPILKRLQSFNAVEGNVAAVFIKDFKTGAELRINDQLPFSAQGWLRLGVILEAYRLIQDTPPQSVAQQLDAIALRGDSNSANELLKTLGRSDLQVGIDQLNDTLAKLGLRSTFLAQPFGQYGLAATFVTPANSQPDAAARTKPDPHAQSTLAEVAALLETIEQCRNGVGGLPLAFPGAFTPIKCAQIMDLLSRNKINALIESGSPGASVAHRQSWDDNNHGDAAVVRTPGRTYMIVIMLHSSQPLQWSETSVMISDIARLTYMLFNNQLPPAAPGISAPPAP